MLGARILKDRSLNSTAMTTAVQPSELVFEFASNGMDEINQVNGTPLLSLNTVRYKAMPEFSVPLIWCVTQHSRQTEVTGGRTGCNLPRRTEGRGWSREEVWEEEHGAQRSTETERLRNVLGA